MNYNIGKYNSNWKGGRNNVHGYIYIHNKEHPFANVRGSVAEHRLVYEKYYNCNLLPWALIHHINGIRDDNRIENLEAVSKGWHNHIHTTVDMDDRFCSICGSKKTLPQIYPNGPRPHWYRYERGHICKLCYEARRRDGKAYN